MPENLEPDKAEISPFHNSVPFIVKRMQVYYSTRAENVRTRFYHLMVTIFQHYTLENICIKFLAM